MCDCRCVGWSVRLHAGRDLRRALLCRLSSSAQSDVADTPSFLPDDRLHLAAVVTHHGPDRRLSAPHSPLVRRQEVSRDLGGSNPGEDLHALPRRSPSGNSHPVDVRHVRDDRSDAVQGNSHHSRLVSKLNPCDLGKISYFRITLR